MGAEAGDTLVPDNPADLFEQYFFVKPAARVRPSRKRVGREAEERRKQP